MCVAQSATERSFRWDDGSLLVEPSAEFVNKGLAVLKAPSKALLGGVARECRGTLDLEQRSDQTKTRARLVNPRAPRRRS